MASRDIMSVIEVNKHAGAWPSGKATDFESVYLARSKMLTSTPQACGLDWAFFPDWLTLDQASFLSGLDVRLVEEIANDDGVELNPAGLIDKQSLWDFLEALTLILHWYE